MQSCLIIQTAFFGDVILATALVEQIAEAFPNAAIDMLVQKSREVLLENNPHIREVLLLDKGEKYRSTYRLIKCIRQKRYDRVINIHRHGSSGLIAGLSGAKEIVGFKAHPLSFLFHRKVRHVREGRHEVQRNQDLISHFIEGTATRPKLYPSSENWVDTARTRPYVTISPASVWATKRWPAAKWSKLIDLIDVDTDVILLGGPGDVPLCEEVAQGANRSVEIQAGSLSFLASAALMSKAKMNYTNDSAPVHIASAMNAPVVAVFCSTVPAFGYGPISDQARIAEYNETLACRPCGIHGHRRCPEGHFRCADIAPSEVL